MVSSWIVGLGLSMSGPSYAQSFVSPSEEEMIRCQCDEYGVRLNDLRTSRTYVLYDSAVAGLGFTSLTRTSPQIIEGSVVVELLPSGGRISPVGEIHTQTVVQGQHYVERVVYYDSYGVGDVFNSDAFRLRVFGPAQDWEDVGPQLLDDHPAARLAEEDLLYGAPPSEDAADMIPAFASNSNSLRSFALYQSGSKDPVGWLMRERKFFGALTGFRYVDHWAFTEAYEPLKDVGDIVTLYAEGDYASLDAWYDDVLQEAVETYARVEPHQFAPLGLAEFSE